MENGFAVYTGGFIGGTDHITLLPAMTALQGQAPFLRKKGKAAFAATWASVKQKRPLASQWRGALQTFSGQAASQWPIEGCPSGPTGWLRGGLAS